MEGSGLNGKEVQKEGGVVYVYMRGWLTLLYSRN